MIMSIQNLVSICLFFLKILSKNQILTSIKNGNSVANLRKTMIYDTNIEVVNDNVYTKFGHNLSIRFQDIEQKLNSDDDPWGVVNLDPRGMIGRIYTLNIQALGHVVLEKKIFKCFSHYKPMADNDAPGAWPIWTPGSLLTGIIKGLT